MRIKPAFKIPIRLYAKEMVQSSQDFHCILAYWEGGKYNPLSLLYVPLPVFHLLADF